MVSSELPLLVQQAEEFIKNTNPLFTDLLMPPLTPFIFGSAWNIHGSSLQLNYTESLVGILVTL